MQPYKPSDVIEYHNVFNEFDYESICREMDAGSGSMVTRVT